MDKSLTLAVIGGDERQVFLASLALADGHAVRTFALDRANIAGAAVCSDAASCTEGADAVLLPVPVMQGDGLLRAPLARTETDVMQVLDAIPAGVPAFGGAVPFRLHARAVQCGVRLIDYLSREELAIRNAVPTCEGALQLAMEQTDCTIQGAHVLVIGAGRIGFLLAVRLHALGAQVIVAARSLRDRARIESGGYSTACTGGARQGDHLQYCARTAFDGRDTARADAILHCDRPCVHAGRCCTGCRSSNGLPGNTRLVSARKGCAAHGCCRDLCYGDRYTARGGRAVKIGFVMTGSFCTFVKALRAMENLVSLGHSVTPILSEHAGGMDTRFGTADDLRERLRNITGSEIIDSIAGAEPIGPKRMFDVLIVVPCTGNTLAKLSHGITDTTAAMAVKSHLRSERPVVLALSTNDALAASAENIGRLLNRRHYYFVPFGQDDPESKPRSLVSELSLLPETMEAALEGRQLQPILVSF